MPIGLYGKPEQGIAESGKLDIFDHRTREKLNCKWNFHKVANVKVFASMPKKITMGCKGTVLPDSLLRYPIVKHLMFEKENQTTLK